MKQKKAKSFARKGRSIRQVGALPYRLGSDGALELLLITSGRLHRFFLPKGWRMKKRSDSEAAAIEARQEAGVVGIVADEPLGEYHYWKRFRSIFVPVAVKVFALRVTDELPTWRESGKRRRSWASWSQARTLIDEPELVSLIDRFCHEPERLTGLNLRNNDEPGLSLPDRHDGHRAYPGQLD